MDPTAHEVKSLLEELEQRAFQLQFVRLHRGIQSSPTG
jgi:hypothetical protein